MKKFKTPGSDGLPAEFYLSPRPVLGKDLVEVLNYSHSNGILCDSMRLALITLLLKKESIFTIKNRLVKEAKSLSL